MTGLITLLITLYIIISYCLMYFIFSKYIEKYELSYSSRKASGWTYWNLAEIRAWCVLGFFFSPTYTAKYLFKYPNRISILTNIGQQKYKDWLENND